ncbi:MAG: PAS domain-containing protein, partial [Firmicutes bacterium]|nr:PAS domain-containing protein [Bacillota bacterium]
VSRVKEGLANLEGDLSYRLPPAFGELGEIAAAVNHLAGRLEQMRSFNEAILDSVDAGVVAADIKGRFVMVNPSAAKVLGIDPHDVIGRHFEEVFEVNDPVREVLEQALIRKETVTDLALKYTVTHKVEKAVSNPAGGQSRPQEERDLILGTNLLTSQAGNPIGVVLTFSDVTERNRLQERIKREERLAALGRFVAGVAHEIRNPLTSISGYIQLWQRHGQPTPQSLPTVARETMRLNAIVDKLLFFARPSEAKFQPYDLNRIVNIVLEFIGEGCGSEVKVETELMPDLPPVNMDPEQMQQVLMNIFYNSYQAMPEGGTLRVETGLTPDGEYVVITIADTGCGIPQENLSRIFDPFFTTKARGSGLGLALVHEIVEAHGGYVDVKSKVGVGTTMRVYLPRFKEAAGHAARVGG